MNWRGAAVALLLLGTGCYKATFIRDPNAVRGVERDKWVDYFLWGLVNEQTYDVKEFCPDGRIAQVQTGANFGTGIVSLVTLCIYSPRKLYVTCAADGRALRLEMDEQGKLVAVAEVPR